MSESVACPTTEKVISFEDNRLQNNLLDESHPELKCVIECVDKVSLKLYKLSTWGEPSKTNTSAMINAKAT